MTKNYLWWQTGVIYQIYPRSYKDTTGNGVGDLGGIIGKLDYLNEALGVDAIWLSPFYPSPMKDFGYDVADYCDVHPLFGSLDDFDELLTGAHDRGIRLIVDLVPNHSSDQHAWFQESRSSRDNPKRDWYVWASNSRYGSHKLDSDGLQTERRSFQAVFRKMTCKLGQIGNCCVWADPLPHSRPLPHPQPLSRGERGGNTPPNNWLSVFGGSAWEWDQATSQYYLHSFLKEQPELNWRNPELREAMFDVVRFWLERGVDGFRVDVAHFIMKDPQMRDNPPNSSQDLSLHRPHGDYDSQLHIYDKGHPDVHKVYREFRSVLDEYSADSPRMAVGEIHIFDWDAWASYYGKNLDEFHMPFNFGLLKIEWQAQAIRQHVDEIEAALPPGAWPNYVLGNHDESRIASRYGKQQARVAAMLLLTLRGTPTIYYGDEIGMVDVDISPERQLDPFGLRVPGWGRDRCRTPMQWAAEPQAGFAPEETNDLWLPLADDWPEANVQAQLNDPASMLTFYRQLLSIRKANPALQWGHYQPVDAGVEACFVYRRWEAGQSIIVALNFTGDSQRIPLSGNGKILLSTYLDRDGAINLKDLNLRPNEGMVFEICKSDRFAYSGIGNPIYS
ncbi:MAG: alpha-amylase family glycosyl hydrolase [Chloroflexota bacterium]|nr:alpha-amylase family glycosyl hydrolase [Chloroflexota bacterium]